MIKWTCTFNKDDRAWTTAEVWYRLDTLDMPDGKMAWMISTAGNYTEDTPPLAQGYAPTIEAAQRAAQAAVAAHILQGDPPAAVEINPEALGSTESST